MLCNCSWRYTTDTVNVKSTLIHVMTGCHQAVNHYLDQFWPRFMSPCGVNRTEAVKDYMCQTFITYIYIYICIYFGIFFLWCSLKLYHWDMREGCLILCGSARISYISFCMKEIWQHAPRALAKDNYQLRANCFMRWMPVAHRGPQNLRHSMAAHCCRQLRNYSAMTHPLKTDWHRMSGITHWLQFYMEVRVFDTQVNNRAT